MKEPSYGYAHLKMGTIDAVTGLPAGLTTVGKIVKNSASFSESEGTTTQHFSELSQFPEVEIQEKGAAVLTFQLMEVTPDNAVRFAGGTVTDGDGSPDIWNAPRGIVNIEGSFEAQSEDGRVLTINRGKVTARANMALSTQGLWAFDVKIAVLQPELGADLPPWTWTNNTDEPAA